ncbi:type II CAAX prenyl endopeptidase Rce1 family protein [Pedobacter aquatilis]|uniref:CPBP family glutamic-type intramembrane protease n=1 Tax=Pedobacter aquatilis TaxID=351343 RepID=UPI003977A94B
MLKTLSMYWRFLQNPKLLKQSKDNKTLWSEFFWLLLLNLLFGGIVISTYLILLHFKIINEYEENIDLLKQYGVVLGFIVICILTPIIEEYLFRWHLRKRHGTIYFTCFVLASITSFLLDKSYLTWAVFAFFIILAFILHGYINRISMTKRQLVWDKSYWLIFYLTAIFFGLIHFSNIKGLTLSDPSFLIFTLSQMFGGLSLGYLRIKYGIRYSILLHGCFNLILLLLELAFG